MSLHSPILVDPQVLSIARLLNYFLVTLYADRTSSRGEISGVGTDVSGSGSI
jgi:hypothetical protein